MTSYDYDICDVIGMRKKVLLQTLCHHSSGFGGGHSHCKDSCPVGCQSWRCHWSQIKKQQSFVFSVTFQGE